MSFENNIVEPECHCENEKRLFEAIDSNVNIKSLGGLTPLHYAETKEITKLLLEAGANVNNLEKVKDLIESGVNINCRDKREHLNSPLHFASCYGFSDIVLYLLQKGANTNLVNDAGQTPIKWASSEEITMLF